MSRSHYFATERERREAVQAAFARIARSWKWRLSLLAVFVLTIVGCAAIPRISWPSIWFVAAVGMCWSLSLVFGLNLLWRKAWIRELRCLLRERGVPICLHCGYDLRGLAEARCPECGHVFEPQVLQLQPPSSEI